ncbi:hypothetical protein BT93_K2019 [Corymbia citriodora subsp. variegata]|nr:hypothetical protein BT93_K2019 [Corymbia citriodora subsp. variegata]
MTMIRRIFFPLKKSSKGCGGEVLASLCTHNRNRAPSLPPSPSISFLPSFLPSAILVSSPPRIPSPFRRRRPPPRILALLPLPPSSPIGILDGGFASGRRESPSSSSDESNPIDGDGVSCEGDGGYSRLELPASVLAPCVGARAHGEKS